MPIGVQLLQHTVYIYRDPVWVDDIDPVWVIQIEITVSYGDSTFEYIQLIPISTSKVFLDMKHKINDKNM